MMDRTREQEVWSRVMAASAEAPAPAAERAPAAKPAQQSRGLTEAQVQMLLAEKAADVNTYRSMAAKVQSGRRRMLEQLAMENRNQARQLAAVYYLMTGRRPRMEQPQTSDTAYNPEALRTRYQAETAEAARYHSLAEGAGSFSGIFHDLGNAGERHGQMIIKLLQGWLG